MNKKTLAAIIGVIVVIIILILLGLKSCNPRVKEQPATTTDQTATDTERTGFINANIDFTCQVLHNPDLTKDKATTETTVKETFKKYNLPVDDNAAMVTLLQKYETDTEATATIKTNSQPCSSGGEPIFVK